MSHIIGQDEKGLAKRCFQTRFYISENDLVQSWNEVPTRIFAEDGAYVVSQSTPQELASFLLEYHQNNYD